MTTGGPGQPSEGWDQAGAGASQPPPSAGQQPPLPPPPYGYAPAPPYGYGPAPAYGYGPPRPQTEGTAITALVLAAASWVVCPVVLAVVALALCPSARRKIESSGGALTGEGLVTAAKIVAWINIGLYAVITLAFIVIAIVAAAVDETDELSMAVLALRGAVV